MSGSKRRSNPPLGDWIVRSPSDNTPEGMLRAPPGSPGAQNIPVPQEPTQWGRQWSDSPSSWPQMRTPTLPQGAPHAPSSQVERPWNLIHRTAYPSDPPGTQWLRGQTAYLQQTGQMQAPSFVVGNPQGLQQPGNLDLNARPQVRNPDGSISTVRTITIMTDHGAFVLPTVIGNRVVSNQEAIQHWQQTGEHLGLFDTEENANAYAQALHQAQAQQYAP